MRIRWLMAIALAAVFGCGGHDPEPELRASDCETCHLSDYDLATNPVHVGLRAERCVACHNNDSWSPTDNRGHEILFPITKGSHQGFSCAECHPAPENTLAFTCLECHGHPQPETDADHSGISGYRYESQRCLDCHPRGQE